MARSEPYVVEEHHSKGLTVHHFDSKTEAHAFGMSLRREGKEAYAFSKKNYAKQNPSGLSSWAAKRSAGSRDEYVRDEQGRFAPK